MFQRPSFFGGVAGTRRLLLPAVFSILIAFTACDNAEAWVSHDTGIPYTVSLPPDWVKRDPFSDFRRDGVRFDGPEGNAMVVITAIAATDDDPVDDIYRRFVEAKEQHRFVEVLDIQEIDPGVKRVTTFYPNSSFVGPDICDARIDSFLILDDEERLVDLAVALCPEGQTQYGDRFAQRVFDGFARVGG